jgi:hypothetical protein
LAVDDAQRFASGAEHRPDDSPNEPAERHEADDESEGGEGAEEGHRPFASQAPNQVERPLIREQRTEQAAALEAKLRVVRHRQRPQPGDARRGEQRAA